MRMVWFLGMLIFLFGTFSWVASSSASTYLVALGDSITYGTGDPSKEGYIKRVQVRLEKEKGIPIQLNNYGVPKYTTEDILKQLEEKRIMKQIRKANYIILYVGTNDFRKSADYEFENINTEGMREGRIQYASNFNKILELLRIENSNAPIILLGLYHPYTEYENHKELLGQIELWNDEIITCLEKYNQTYFVPTVDLFINRHKEEVFSDSLHPNPTGYELIADRLLKKLLTLEDERMD